MLTTKKGRTPIVETAAENGAGQLTLDKLLAPPHQAGKLRTFAHAVLEPGASVGYHVHTGESESYYILSGSGTYNDNGKLIPITAGDVTFTPNGEGHGIGNTGKEPLNFIALIILD